MDDGSKVQQWRVSSRAEIRRERDEARAGRALAEELAHAIGLERNLLRRERDEARAEVERLRASETERRELMPAVLDAVRKVAREEEREACAAVADEYAVDARAIAARCDGRFPATAESARIRAEAAEILAAAIRARGEGGAR